MIKRTAPPERARISEAQRRLLVSLCTVNRSGLDGRRSRPTGERRSLAALQNKGLLRAVLNGASEEEVEPTEAAFALLDLAPPAIEQSNDRCKKANLGRTSQRHTTQSPLAITRKKETKASVLFALLRRSDGASLPEMQAAVGWQAHSVRGFLSGTVRKKLGAGLFSFVGDDGVRRYRIEAEASDGA